MQNFGSYELKLTLFAPLIILLIPVGFIAGWGPLARPPVRTPAARVANARSNARTIALLGLLALLIAAVGGGLGYLKMHTPLTHADLKAHELYAEASQRRALTLWLLHGSTLPTARWDLMRQMPAAGR